MSQDDPLPECGGSPFGARLEYRRVTISVCNSLLPFWGSSAAERSAPYREGAGSIPAPRFRLLRNKQWRCGEPSMSEERTSSQTLQANPGYACFQIAKALRTIESHADPATRERALQKIANWEAILNGMFGGTLEVGSRSPVAETPTWVTPEVVKGGFATGALLASGPLADHERRLLEEIGSPNVESDARRTLNGFFLSDVGIAKLQAMLRAGNFDINLPEEGALLVVAWLLGQGHSDQARNLLETIGPFLGRLRFYPAPTEHPRRFGSRVFLQDVQTTRSVLAAVRSNRRLLAQREAVEVWAPLFDVLVSLFLETVDGATPGFRQTESTESLVGGWPCQTYPPGWRDRVLGWLAEFDRLRETHRITQKPERKRSHFAQLRELAKRCVTDPRSLSGREVGRIRLILAQSVAKNGQPGSAALKEKRAKQLAQSTRPLFSEVASVLAERLAPFPKDEGLSDPQTVTYPVTAEEELRTEISVGTSVPDSLRRKVERCLCDTVEVLVERGLITSGEVLARLLPQLTASQRATGFVDPTLQSLYSAIYRAFRRRRSLLLLNPQSQVKLEELPWIAAIEQFRIKSASDKEAARSALEQVASLTIASFPHVILPNKLLQELWALVKGAELDLPLVDELAADIFMGQFSGKFVQAAKQAAELLRGSLYAQYFGIDYDQVLRLPEEEKRPARRWFGSSAPTDVFAQLCAARAGVPLGTWRPATNGMVIEQQQIITSQNLATLIGGLNLTNSLRDRLPELARDCYAWIIRRLQIKTSDYHARLIAVKNCAYAWRQMVFYLALAAKSELELFLNWSEEHLQRQPVEFRSRFQPAQSGLKLAVGGDSLDTPDARQAGACRFLGWSKDRHWLC
jgi:hypothetical protein